MGRNRATSMASTRSGETTTQVGVNRRRAREGWLTVRRSWGACTTTWPRQYCLGPAAQASRWTLPTPSTAPCLPPARRSCLLHRFVRDEWRVLSSQTIGVEFSSKIVHIADRKSSSLSNRKRIKLQLWDTAGTERFRSVSRSYYRGAAGAILVYDVSSWRSFEQLQTFLNDARALAGPDITIILAGNKSDVVDGLAPPPGAGYSYASTPSSDYGLPPPTPSSQSSLSLNLNNHYTIAPEGREVSQEAASRWASANGIPVAVEVSALNGENVEELFNRLARMILTKIELGEIDPDDPQSGIQYGDLGWDDGASSIISGHPNGSVRWRGGKKKPRTEWEEVFRLSGGTRRGGGCC